MKCPVCNTTYLSNLDSCPTCSCLNPTHPNAKFKKDPLSAPTAVELLKGIGSSNLFLVGTIIYSVYCFLTLVMAGTIPLIETAMTVGLWLFYVECKKQSNDPYSMSTVSLTVIKVVETIYLVVYWILTILIGIITLICLLAILGGNNSSSDVAIGGFAIIVLVIIDALVIVQIMLRNGILSYINAAIDSAKTGTRPRGMNPNTPHLWIGLSIASGVMSFIVFSAAEMVLSPIYDLVDELNSYASIISSSDILPDIESALVSSLILALIPVAYNIVFSKVLLDARAVAEKSYYPTESEVIYHKAARMERMATSNGQGTYGGGYQPNGSQPNGQQAPQQPTYVQQQPPQYQPQAPYVQQPPQYQPQTPYVQQQPPQYQPQAPYVQQQPPQYQPQPQPQAQQPQPRPDSANTTDNKQ